MKASKPLTDIDINKVEQFISNALEKGEVFELWELFRAVPELLEYNPATKTKNNIDEAIVGLLSCNYPYVIKANHDEEDLLNYVKEVVRTNALSGSVIVDHNNYNEHDLYCSDEKTAAILALHF